MNRFISINLSQVQVSVFPPPHPSVIRGLITPPPEAGRGQARKLLETVTDQADEEGRDLILQFEPSDRTDPVRLERLYRSVGFVFCTEVTSYRWRKIREFGPMYRDSTMYRPHRR